MMMNGYAAGEGNTWYGRFATPQYPRVKISEAVETTNLPQSFSLSDSLRTIADSLGTVSNSLNDLADALEK